MSQEIELPAPLHRLFDAPTKLARPATSAGYRLALALSGFVMVLLPLVYVGLIGLAGWALYVYCAEYFLPILTFGEGRIRAIMAVLASTPVVVGLAIVVALCHPFFARRGERQQPITVQAKDEPLFVAYVQRICQLLGAPTPREIRLDCSVNASAAFRRGLLSLGRPDLVLTIGVPLIVGLSSRQLAGVIAHEFGHFRQGGAMRLSYLVRSINLWFAHAVYGRGRLDGWVAGSLEDEDVSFGTKFMALCAGAGVGLSRLLLKVLMYFGHGVSGFLLRQMEFDADRAEVQIAGTAAFAEVMRRLLEMETAARQSYREAARQWEATMQLPDNLPLLIVQRSHALSPQEKKKVEASLAEKVTGWFDTHPAHGARLAAVQRQPEAGLFEEDAPAGELLQNLANFGKFVTLIHYQDDLELPTRADCLVPITGPATAAPSLTRTAALPPPAPVPVAFNVPVWRGKPVKSETGS